MVSVDKEALTQQLNKVLSYSQVIPASQIDCSKLIDTWYQNKQAFIERFGGLIYEYPVPISFTISEQEKHSHLMDFCDYLGMQYPELADFVYDMQSGFYDNRTTSDYLTYNGLMIPKNTKLVKAFKYFVGNHAMLELFQNKASMMIQSNKITGTLCFSVHPLDFLSSSANTHNWRSCHSLDGDYRAGNLSYMTDNATFMCYLKSDEDTELPMFPPEVLWNSKKWRMLLHTNSDFNIIFAGRQYPFAATLALEQMHDIILQALQIPVDSYDNWKSADGLPLRSCIHDPEDFALHYNDLLYSTCYKPSYMQALERDKSFHIYIGNQVLCPICHTHLIEESSMMLCPYCAYQVYQLDYIECQNCRHITSQGYELEGTILCPDCYDELVGSCEVCGDDYYATSLSLITDSRSGTDKCACPACQQYLNTIYIKDDEE